MQVPFHSTSAIDYMETVKGRQTVLTSAIKRSGQNYFGPYEIEVPVPHLL